MNESNARYTLAQKILLYALLILLAIIVLFPFYQAIVTSLGTEADVSNYPPKIFPTGLNFQSYGDALAMAPLLRYMLNSIIQASTVTLSPGKTLRSPDVTTRLYRYGNLNDRPGSDIDATIPIGSARKTAISSTTSCRRIMTWRCSRRSSTRTAPPRTRNSTAKSGARSSPAAGSSFATT